jgi:adenosylmethionine-8-amino-7-oxononanoate aminotransferase
VALANLDIFEREHLLDNVRTLAPGFRERIDGLLDIPIVGDVRGTGYFLGLELVRDQATAARFERREVEEVLRGFLAPRLFDAGLICRTDDRGDPVIQLSPPLIAGDAELDVIESILRTALTEAWEKFCA